MFWPWAGSRGFRIISFLLQQTTNEVFHNVVWTKDKEHIRVHIIYWKIVFSFWYIWYMWNIFDYWDHFEDDPLQVIQMCFFFLFWVFEPLIIHHQEWLFILNLPLWWKFMDLVWSDFEPLLSLSALLLSHDICKFVLPALFFSLSLPRHDICKSTGSVSAV